MELDNPGVGAVMQPSGTVTMVFTDIEGSTRLLDELGAEAYREALAEHRLVLRDACARYEGYEVDAAGDAFFYTFASAQAAVSALREAMLGLAGSPIRIRVGIHTGEPVLDPPRYVGMDVHQAARIMASAHGGQVVLSPSTVARLEPSSVGLKPLGEHRLKDMPAPLPLAQLLIDGLPSEFPPLRTLYRSNLPVPATPFLGREMEIAHVAALLEDPAVRLLTLTGPGGTGKTRLAVQAAAAASGDYPDGVTWVGLAPVRDPALVVSAIAQELNVREQPGDSLRETLVSVLAGKKHLLLLDNLEQLLPGVVSDVAELLAGCPTLKLLVTSRERLQLEAETVWAVPAMTEADAETFFVERARAAGVELEGDGAVAGLCRRLDDLPLAIQLAAARTRSLAPAAILDRLDERLALLTSRSRDLDERQRTISATIAWSYDLLDPREQRALRVLSVFAGGWTAGAAAEVAGADLDLLESLVDKSLIRYQTPDDPNRYWMLETIREYAQARLEEAGEAGSALDAFLGWLDGVVGAVDELWLERDQLAWFRALERERANLVHGVAESRAQGRADRALRLLVAADDFIDTWGPYAPFAELLDGATCGDPELDRRSRLLYLRLLVRLGRFREAAAGAAAFRAELGDDVALHGRLLAMQAYATLVQGDVREAFSLAAEAVRLARQADDRRGLADALNSLAGVELKMGELAAGHAHFQEAEAVAEGSGDRHNAGTVRSNRALLLLADRKPAEACALLRAVTEDVRELEGSVSTAWQLSNLAMGLAASGDTDGARDALREALELDTMQQPPSFPVEAPLVLAIAAAHDGALDVAAALWSAAEAADARVEYTLGPELKVYVADVLEPLRGEPGFAEHRRRGRSLSLDEAVALGLGLEEAERGSLSTRLMCGGASSSSGREPEPTVLDNRRSAMSSRVVELP